MKKEDKFKPYVYKVYNRNGKLEEYSGYFSTKEEAINWRTKKGEWLSNHFKRELILTEEYKLFTYVPSTLFDRQRN